MTPMNQQELTLELANVLSGAFIHGLSDELKIQLDFGPPSLLNQLASVDKIFERRELLWTDALFLSVGYAVNSMSMRAHLILCMIEEDSHELYHLINRVKRCVLNRLMKSLLEQAFMQVNIGIIAIDRQYNIILCNHFVSDFSKKSVEELTNNNLFDAFPKLPKNWLQRRIDSIFLLKNSSFISWEQRPSLFDLLNSRPITGSTEKMIQNCSLFPVVDEKRNVSHVCITINDATAIAVNQIQLKQTYQRLVTEKKEQQKLIKKLEETKNQLLQSEKMASIGQLAAGVAHEINNPVGFIKSNFSSLKHYAAGLNTVIKQYEEMLQAFANEEVNQKMAALNEEHDLNFVLEDIDSLLLESFDGITRIEEIVKSLKHFSRADSNRWEEADINQGLESTLRVVAHELKYIASLEKDFATLPLIQCLPMQLNQVFMNLLVNAGQAIGKDNKEGKI